MGRGATHRHGVRADSTFWHRSGGDRVSLAAELSAEKDVRPEVIATARVEPADDLALTVIEPRPGWQVVSIPELWRYRELLYFLTWRDVKVRYKQTALGAAW